MDVVTEAVEASALRGDGELAGDVACNYDTSGTFDSS